MLSIEACKKILNKNGQNYTDEEVIKIRELFQEWIEIDYYNKKIKTSDEESSDHVKSVKR